MNDGEYQPPVPPPLPFSSTYSSSSGRRQRARRPETIFPRITDPEEAKTFFMPLTLSRDKSVRSRAMRAVMAAALFKGECQARVADDCQMKIADYGNLYYWHFDHMHDLQEYPVSPVSGITQFRLSGNSLVNHNFAKALQHCKQDTQLLCKECHWQKTFGTESHRRSVATRVRLLTDDILRGAHSST